MPRTSYTSRTRTSYVPRRRGCPTGTSVRKPYGGSRYGNDAYVKVEAIENLSNTVGNEVFSTMRVSQVVAPSPGNSYLG